MKPGIFVALIGLLPVGASVAAEKWNVQGELALPALPPATPAGSAGCVVVGHHVLADGSSAKPRILQGAFTANVDAASREAFSAGALEAARRWRFTPTDPAARGAFNVETVGFVPADDNSPRVVIGASNQVERLRSVCDIADFAPWGEQNAIPVEQAKAQNADKVIVDDGGPELFWVSLGRMTPPRYPLATARTGMEACVVVGFTVGVDGSVGGLKIMSSAFQGNVPWPLRKEFEDGAASAASTWRFAPGPDNLGRMPTFMQVPIFFETRGSRWDPDACRATDVGALTQPSSG